MKPYFQDADVTLFHGDCLDVLRTLPDCSVDAVVTDPPYGLEFMGKDWDGADGFRRSLNAADAGRDNAFGRTSKTSPEYRTTSKASAGMMPTGYTDGANRLERPSHLGGLNPKCRNCDHWQRGGNPCACDAPDFPNERLPRLHDFQMWCEAWSVECLRVLKPGGFMLAFGGTRTSHRLACAVEDAGFEIRDSIAWLYGSGFPKHRASLKPAFEPIVMGRKPFGTSLIVNEAKYGTGALNIEGCRVGDDVRQAAFTSLAPAHGNRLGAEGTQEARRGTQGEPKEYTGRWPTNVVLDGSQADAVDAQSGTLHSQDPATRASKSKTTGVTEMGTGRSLEYADTGGASRFFPTFRYEAKAPAIERPRHGETAHPTVKPLDLMRWLVRLVTPPGGTVLEPFAGSGTTAEACILEGFKCIAIEREADYLPLIIQRISKPLQVGFDLREGA